jgi:tetratricopeptide (TPR) repeat protein
MGRHLNALCGSLLVLACLAPAAAAQKGKEEKEPPRPRFPIGVDTNESQVYYDFGLEKLENDPQKAADAFYWAARLNPTRAEAYYARRTALMLTDDRRLGRYYEGDRGTIQSAEMRRIDSLYLYALTINPFFSRSLDIRLLQRLDRAYALEVERRYNVSSSEVQYYLDQMRRSGPVADRAWRAYSDGRYQEALSLYAAAIKSARRKAGLRIERGRLFFQINEPDSALSELTLALEELRKTDKKDIVFLYDSKALTEHSIGLAQVRIGNVAGAKEAFGRALQEDLSYFPAHMQLSYLALEAKDTATALNEMDLAVQIRDDDVNLHFVYGFVLAASQKHTDAETHLRKAVALNSVYAAPHFSLAQVLDKQGKGADAVTEYKVFLGLASKNDLRRKETEERIKALASATP